MAHLCPQRSTEFHTFDAASNPSSVQQHVECPESNETAKSNTNQKRTCRLFRGSNPNKLAESDESNRSYTKKICRIVQQLASPLARGPAAIAASRQAVSVCSSPLPYQSRFGAGA